MHPPDARLYIVGLIVDCPYEPNPEDCALHDIRQKPLRERIEWSKQLTNEEIQDIISVHKKCLAEKEGRVGLSET